MSSLFYIFFLLMLGTNNFLDPTSLSYSKKRGWDKSPSLSIVFGLSSKMQWLSGLYYADFISFYSPTQLCGGGTTKSNSNELPISVHSLDNSYPLKLATWKSGITLESTISSPICTPAFYASLSRSSLTARMCTPVTRSTYFS